MDIKADFDTENKQIKIEQTITYINTSNDVLTEIYLNDWIQSFSSKTTPLAKRFAEEYKTVFHFAKSEDRGYTAITAMTQNGQELSFNRLKDQPDVIKVIPVTPIKPNESYTIELKYVVQVPNDKFTRYGVSDLGEYHLRYWYITPAIYNGKWQYYSNKDLDDMFIPKSDISMEVRFPKDLYLASELNVLSTKNDGNKQIITLEGKDRINTKLFLDRLKRFSQVETEYFTLIYNIDNENLNLVDQLINIDKIAGFLDQNLGSYPHENLLLTHIDYKKNPIYGLNLLPDFIRPFPDQFQYELKILKTALNNYLENILLINPREDQWLIDGLQTYFLIKYVDENYPEMKIFGTLSNVWGIRTFHAAELDFNDQYNFLYMHMARTNLDQPLLMQKDSLLKFNMNIANKYKAGVGLRYLDDYVNANILENTIKEFISNQSLKETNTGDFEQLIKSKTSKNIHWFFDEYLKTSKKIDFKIKEVQEFPDSIQVTIKNKRDNHMPVSLFGLRKDSVVYKTWVDDINKSKTVTVPKDHIDKLVLNYDKSIPEFNLRDNWKSMKGFLFNNKPIQFRLFKDIEDPYYNQIFFMPQIKYNYYDGFAPGLKLYNKTVLTKAFNYNLRPSYALKSQQLVGSGNVSYIQRPENRDLYYIRYGFSGAYSNYAPNLSYTSLQPYVQFRFRDHKDLRNNRKNYLTFRYVSINREEDPLGIYNVEEEPSYGVFNAQFGHSNPNLKNYKFWNTDLQLAKNFGKASFNYEFRTLTEGNRQYNLRFFGGVFLYNKTYENSNFFSFALDRPTDYLFDYNYYGRSENTGIFSQQLIIAEGGFKSKLNPAYANQWITTLNGSATIWKYIHAYGDIGLVKNHDFNPEFVYDSGIRFSLVEDYFELYFPVYSNLGWEVAQPNYEEKIRFIVTLDIKTLFGLFTRRWY